VLYLAAAPLPEEITRLIDGLAGGHDFPPHEGRLTVRDARQLMLWQPRGRARLTGWIAEIQAEMLVVDTVQAATGSLVPALLATTMDKALRPFADDGGRVIALDCPSAWERDRLGSWTLPSGNSCDVYYSSETGLAVAWDHAPSPTWSREDRDYYVGVVRPAILERVATQTGQRMLMVDLGERP
jgi:hypothetical protein